MAESRPVSRSVPLEDLLRALRVSHSAGETLGNPYVRLDADLVAEVIRLLTPASEKPAQLAPPTQDEIADYRDLFRRELDKNMHNSSSSPSTEAHAIALRTFVDKRNAANR